MCFSITCMECGEVVYDSVVDDALMIHGLDLNDCECPYCGEHNTLEKLDY